jgi:hypothetical protein
MSRRGATLLFVVLAVILALALVRLRGPDPAPVGVPADQFSAARAIAIVADLLREGIPHAVGSEANRVIRDRILARFRALGHAPAIQQAFVCNVRPTCATVENIVAMPPGTSNVVLLTAHYDSVPAGPGASDDGVGVAVLLETARALGVHSRVGYVITDGEEAGLLGAEALMKLPGTDRIDVVVNVENRGTSGPSFLFETSRGNAGLIDAMRAMKRPFASSLFYTVYDLLPNDTDLTVFKRTGLQGVNFGAIGDVWYYHTPLDDLAHVKPRTVQHHGDNVLAVTRALARETERLPRDAVFFDVLGLFIVSWPESWTLWIALASALILLNATRRSFHGAAIGFFSFFGSVVLAALLAFALTWIAHLRADGAARLAYPQALIAAMWITGAISVFAVMARRKGAYAGVSLALHVIAIALALALPGVAYIFLIPAVASMICVLAGARFDISSVAAALFIIPLGMYLYTALAKVALIPTAVLLAILFAAPAALLPRNRKVLGALAIAAIILVAATLILPARTADRYRRPSTRRELGPDSVQISRTGGMITARATRPLHVLEFEFDRRPQILRVNGQNTARGKVVRVWGQEARVETRPPVPAKVRGIVFAAR